jgi:2-amino-4-hydroxy-6-hydroxymethyldihydropteridine diphosphokinase
VHKAAVALGSNLPSELGGPRENLDAAVAWIGVLGRVSAVSAYIATAPEINTDQPEFLNAALVLETALGPLELMRALLALEASMGRVRTGIPSKGPRVIDLDLIFFDDLVLESEELTLPHPGVAERRFVLAPLAEIAAGWVHPGTGLTVGEMLGRFGGYPPPVLRSESPENKPLKSEI